MPFRRCIPIALMILPYIVSGVPWDSAESLGPAQDNIFVTATLTSTLIVTGPQAATTANPDGSDTATSVSSTPAGTIVSSSSAPNPGVTTSEGYQAIFFLPPDDAGSSSVMASPITETSASSIQTSSTTTQTLIPTTTSLPSSSATGIEANVAPSTSAASGPAVTPLVMAYYPDWAAPLFPPEKIDFGRFDWIDFAFAVLDQNFDLTWDGSDEAPGLLQRLVTVAHDSGAKVKLSIGGWTGSQYFSPAVADTQSRQVFANNIRTFYDNFDLDGIDIDWEYPGQTGNDGNIVSPDDTANFLSFLQLLRQSLPTTAKMSAAVQTVPFADADGNPLADVSAFAQVLDWVLIMNYDVWGSSPTPGPNAPLSDGCHNSTQPASNAVAAVRAWTEAGFPADQLVLGVPAYGYLSQSSATRLVQRSTLCSGLGSVPRSHRAHLRNRHRARSSLRLWSDETDSDESTERDTLSSGAMSEEVSDGASANATEGAPGSSAIMATNDDGSPEDGQVQFRGLVEQGILQYSPEEPYDGASADGSVAPMRYVTNRGKEIDSLYDGWSGFSREWDECSSTPFLRSATADQVVTYDDPLSLGMKAAFVQGVGLLGVNMFDISGDTDQWDLTDALRKGLGLD